MIVILALCLFWIPSAHAESLEAAKAFTQVQATITNIQEEIVDENGLRTYVFEAELDSGTRVVARTEESHPKGLPIRLKVGKRVFLQYLEGDPPSVFYEGMDRSRALWGILAIFIALSLVIGGKRGFASLFGLGITLLVLFGYVFPSILAGKDVLTVTIIGSIGILAVNMHIAHGLRRESFLAFISTVLGFLCVWIFAQLFSLWAGVSGMGSEDVMMLAQDMPFPVLTVRLFLAGVVLGAVGVLDDIAISQTEIVHELASANPALTRKELFLRSMRIGRHHIASTVNTLVLVYAGASMPILVLFLYHSGNVHAFLNSEIVTEEIIRTLAGTAALMLTVPIASFIASFGFPSKTLDTPHDHA